MSQLIDKSDSGSTRICGIYNMDIEMTADLVNTTLRFQDFGSAQLDSILFSNGSNPRASDSQLDSQILTCVVLYSILFIVVCYAAYVWRRIPVYMDYRYLIAVGRPEV